MSDISEENKLRQRLECRCGLPVYNAIIVGGTTVWICEACGGYKPEDE